MDGFAAYGKGGPTSSLSSCYLVCLSLPPEERYKYENMYLAFVIPGPNHPLGDQTNHPLHPLVDDFLKAWWPGIHLTRTPNYPRGRTTRHALVLAVADLLALRQMVGFASHNSKLHWCSFCLLLLGDKEDLNWMSWPRRDCDEHRRLADAWLSAGTKGERDKLWEENGVRWSELLRLPYWRPLKFSAIDVMHTVYLRVVAYHIQGVFGMSFTHEDGLNGIQYDMSKKRPSNEEITDAYKILKTGSAAKLRGLRKASLRLLCKEQNLAFRGGAGKLKQRLLDFVRHVSSLLSDYLKLREATTAPSTGVV